MQSKARSIAWDVLERERSAFVARTPISGARLDRRLAAFPGGDTRAATFYGPYPAQIDRAEGIVLTDLDGNEYLDFLQNFTSLIMGHRHPAVMEVTIEMLGRLTAAAAPVPCQLELAEEIIRRVDSIERLRFTNSGAESTLLAAWAARAYTGRPWLVKAIGGYHGCVPELDRSIRDGYLPPGLPAGTPVKAVPFNDSAALQRVVEELGGALAGIILEPVLGPGGVVRAEPGYLEAARELADSAGALLIFDEVITFRLARGGFQELAGIKPDLTALAKIIGGGFPVGALGGRAEVMDVFRPGAEQGISHSGSFNGNPIAAAAGLRVLELLDDAAYARLDLMGAQLAAGLRTAIADVGLGAQVTHTGSLGFVHFTTEPVRDFDSAQTSDPTALAAYHIGLMNRGLFVAPRGMWAVSAVTTEADVERFVAASAELFEKLA
jgi:glutamate-1-semialdehyde 2,1-aminomutase